MCVKLFILLCLLSISSVCSLAKGEEVEVLLKDGPIKGISQASSVSNSSTTFYAFLGLRYAKAPVGSLRFKPPQPLVPWNDTFDATYEKNICYQVPSDTRLESEDCLFLNLFTPFNMTNVNITNSSLPTFVFIHGGGFIQGSGQISGIGGADFFMDYGVIFVSINYRLGPFGFLSTGDTVLPGNNGLKDQNMAIKWVKDNIQSFGGDPEKITIIGQSSGSASVGYQLLSKKSEGLFTGAIMESGVALTPWAYQRNQTNITYATAGILNESFSNEKYGNSTALLNYLLTCSAYDIDQASKTFLNSVTFGYHQILQGFFYGPVIEVEHEDAFITDRMYTLLENGNFIKVPVLMGFNAEESVGIFNEAFNSTVETLENDPTLMVSNDMHLSSENKSVVGELIKSEYLSDDDIVKKTAKTIKFFTDHSFARSVIKQAEIQSIFVDVFFYVFSYRGVMGGNTVTYPGTGNVAHSEELRYMYVKNITSYETGETLVTSNLTAFSETDLKVHYQFLELWTNFANYRNPTPANSKILGNITWPKINTIQDISLKYLDIGKDLTIRKNPRQRARNFWNKLYLNYAVPPLDTY